ncbi:MAG TPA: hypothetical protein VMJ10_01375 [Kofleriaceae bacterium]|nr:hypothetical protein [Kofleriaceae bacterium]
MKVIEVIQVATVLACWTAGIILRFQPMPARAVGGGLLIAGFLLLAYWVQRSRYARR